MELGENIYKLKNADKNYVSSSWWSQRYVDTCRFKETRRARIRSRFRSTDAHDEQKWIKLRRIVDTKKVQKPCSCVDCKRGTAHSRGGTSVRSWPESVRRVAWFLAKIFTSSRMRTKLRFILLLKFRSRSRFRRINAHAEQKDLSSDNLETLRRSSGAYGQWRSVNKRGSTIKRSRSWSRHDNAITRRDACRSIAWKTLRRPQVLPWVSQRSKTTIDQRGEDYYMQNGQCRTACCSRVVRPFW